MIHFHRLPNPPARLPRSIRRAWVALALWRGWPPAAGTPGTLDFDPYADIPIRLALELARGLESRPPPQTPLQARQSRALPNWR